MIERMKFGTMITRLYKGNRKREVITSPGVGPYMNALKHKKKGQDALMEAVKAMVKEVGK